MDKHLSQKKKQTPNNLLREAREQRGLAHKDVADLIGLPDSHTVGRWERGESFPQPHYRQKLIHLFGKSAEELGLVKARFGEQTSSLEISSNLYESSQTSYIWKIPRPFSSFIGREQDILTVSNMLKQTGIRLVTLLGPGGVGKTRLSIEIAHTLREHFIGGVCFVSLSSVNDPVFVLPTVAHAIGIPDTGVESIIEQIKSVLFNASFLLVLDNFEQVVTAAPLLEELLTACPNLKILVTSRAGLHIQAEYEYPVAPLVIPDLVQVNTPESLMRYPAIYLFVQRVQAILPTFQLTQSNAEVISKICHRLDGLPLAIELAAARMTLLPPQALLSRLAQDFQILKSDLRDQPVRQHTLYDTIKWSYDLLSEQEQWFFRHLSVFPCGCTLDAAEATLRNEHTLDILNIFASLIDKSLLQQVEQEGEVPRYVMLETVREYGLHCLQAYRELEESMRIHATYYLTLLEQAKPHFNDVEQVQWLARLEQEKENLRAALKWLIHQKETERALRFCEAFGKFCGLQGYWREEQYWLTTVLALPWNIEAREIRARVLRRTGHLAYRLRNLSLARSLFEESIVLSRLEDDKQNLAGALVGLGWVLYRQNDITTSSKLLHESVEVARTSADQWTLANALESLARLSLFQGQMDEAHLLLNEGLQLSRVLGEKESLARILTTFVSLELARKHTPQAAALAQESFTLAQELGTKPLIALALDRLGDVALASNEYERATQLFEERIKLANELGDRPTIAVRQLNMAKIALAKGDLRQATTYVEDSLRFFQAQNDIPNISAALKVLGTIKRRQRRRI